MLDMNGTEDEEVKLDDPVEAFQEFQQVLLELSCTRSRML